MSFWGPNYDGFMTMYGFTSTQGDFRQGCLGFPEFWRPLGGGRKHTILASEFDPPDHSGATSPSMSSWGPKHDGFTKDLCLGGNPPGYPL